MRKPFIAFRKVEVGAHFRARNKIWLKIELKGKCVNAIEVSPDTVVVNMESGQFFDDAALVQLVIEELPESTTSVYPVRARTP